AIRVATASSFASRSGWPPARGEARAGDLLPSRWNQRGVERVRLASAAVPEPSTYAMAFAGIACGGYLVGRRRTRA
ncbi:MAG: PEP-CTERM sorting domain-containing protein, partial [Planctomycetota bacterium]